jgi:hypothetical protein
VVAADRAVGRGVAEEAGRIERLGFIAEWSK